ncbi:hypothetical protein QBZ16_000548 [Prototheca wickerhamii]|uniref:Conserved oligomeric Golgi complex subunit 7 n=1 Tax=Prototheca wickerhamii TaxID=3111 RepID=A0AAD9INK1_PROWI|nr:hypothetical protein QBZ16_000548 [Prototheca wickerhamii]
MADLEQFATAKFDAVAYVNDLCKAAPAGVSLERHLTDVELRLQLASDDVTGRLEDASVRAAQRVPALLQELLRIQGDLATAQEAMGEMRSAVAQSSSSSGARAVDRLAALEGVKGRMQAAADALEEASGLASLFHRVDALFEDRDLPAIAEALAGMQRGLAVVGGRAPGVADGPARLAALRARPRPCCRRR